MRVLFLAVTVLVVESALQAGTIVVDFEGIPDSTPLTTQYPGLTVTNATVIAAGISLNEFEFPPHSGTNVAFDDGGPISISFASPVLSFSGFFTYSVPLTLAAFDAGSTLVSSAVSTFSSNLAFSGASGSSPNEFLQVSFGSGISRVIITGDPGGGSFVLDDAAYSTGSSTVPEPGSLALLLSGTVTLAMLRRRLWK